MSKFTGLGTALITPFQNDGQIDFAALDVLLNQQLEAKIDYLVILGTTGEAATIADEEKLQVVNFVCQKCANHPIKLIAGVGSNSTQATLKNMALLESYPLDGFLVVTPFYNKPTQDGLFAHYQKIATATQKDIVLYNVPSRTGINLNWETTLKLAQIPNIVAIKEASSNIGQIINILKNKPENFDVISGNDGEILPLMTMGATGVVSVASNIAPFLMKKLINLITERNYPEAQKLFFDLTDFFHDCFLETNPLPIKAALSWFHLIQNNLRLPLVPASAQTQEKVVQSLQKLLTKYGRI